ncbi:MAG: ABC transporter permease [Acidobacteriia bacterium]|jgi:peptide/nickel transport system permease protein|nr:ABC transporter permease [Terriglobia bacterium]
MAVVGLLAPLLASEKPLLERGSRGLRSPALLVAVGFSAPFDPSARVILRAPVPHAPYDVDLEAVLASPSREHWLGTDGLGRDLTARLIHGARVSLSVGLLTASLALLVGVPLGALAGYRGGTFDAVVSRGIEAFLCFPSLLLALALLAASPAWLAALPDGLRVAIVLGVTGWTTVARYLRGEFLRLKGSEIVEAARASGAGHLRIAVRHVLPSALAPVLVTAAFAVGAAILLEAALSFLGLGVRPPTASWGGLLTEARVHVESAWWLALFPGIALFAAVLACNLVGEGIRDLLDPRARETP